MAENWHVNPRMLGQPRLRAARCANNQRHRSPWGEYILDTVTFEGQIASFDGLVHVLFTGLRISMVNGICTESPSQVVFESRVFIEN